MNINQRFKEVRIALNLTQKEFGEKLNLKPNTVAVIESGRRSVTLETVELLCFKLDVNSDWLLYGTGEMFIPHTLDEELSEKFLEILSDKHDGVPFSIMKKQCLLEILNFDDEQWNDLMKIVAQISENPEIQAYSVNLPVDTFDVELLSAIIAKMTGAELLIDPHKLDKIKKRGNITQERETDEES
ncbi:MAG: helix-turn-helix transcriptional regulator [Clostridia bacterium]|nr:helix-turn-helix transcriptional regulator [Clostridia bacterium]